MLMKRIDDFVALVSMFGWVSVVQAGGDAKVEPQQEIWMTKNAWGCVSKVTTQIQRDGYETSV